MARPLPPLPKPLRAVGAPDAAELARRVDEWARDQQALSEALRSGNPSVLSRLDALEARPIGGGGGSVTFGSPVALTPGDATADGVSTDSVRADHVHGLPPFGDGAGEFCEGDDARLNAVGTYSSIWMPDAEPVSPHADDDECAGSSIAGAWTDWDEGAYVTTTASAANKWYEFTGTGNNATRWAGLYKAIPNSIFSITGKFSWMTSSTANGALRIGVFCGDLATPSTGDIRVISVSSTGVDSTTITETYAAWDGVASAGTTIANVRAAYFRLRCNGTTVASDWSEDGITWVNAASVTTAFTPAHAGVCFRMLTTGVTGWGRVHWIRYRSGAGAADFNQNTGRLVRVPNAA